MMASNLPLPIPPRTPTPPSDDGRDHHAPRMTPGVSVDRDSLSPLKESFPRSITLDPTPSDRLSPTKSSFSLSPRAADTSAVAQNGSSEANAMGPFNFNTTVMSKGPVVKSVGSVQIGDAERSLSRFNANLTTGISRTSDNVAVTSTSTVVFRIKSSSNPHHVRLWHCPIVFPYRH